MSHAHLHPVAVAGLLALTTACGSTATVYTRDSGRFDGHIERSDPTSITLVDGEQRISPPDDPDGADGADRIEPFAHTAIARSQIERIEHPGVGLMAVGGALCMLGIVDLVAFGGNEPREGEGGLDLDFRDISGAMFLVSGAVVGGIGVARYWGSVEATRPAIVVGPGSAAVSGRF